LLAAAPRSLLERRLLIVTGKGGTGKTTVSAALALAGARAGRSVLVVEVGPDEQIPDLLQPGAPPVGHQGRVVVPGLRAMRIEPFEALAEYLGLQLGVRSLVDLVVRNQSFRQLMTAAPGWRELITLGKIWHLAQLEGSPEDGATASSLDQPSHTSAARFDLIVVDAPSTGHGITFLDVPRVVVSAVRAGPLREHTQRVEQLIADPEQTLVVPVTLAEELPTREVGELVQRVREMGIAVDRVIVNALVESPFREEFGPLDEALSRLDPDLDLGELPAPGALTACVRHLRARYELNRRYSAEIRRITGLPAVPLPLLSEGIQGAEQLTTLAASLLAAPRASS
jgi:anion-transporting  ArsA/GET3 family ATPase